MHRHEFVESRFPGYEQCIGCGTYHSTQLLPPDELYKNNYWNGETRSFLKDQIWNLTTEEFGISKVAKVLSYVNQGGTFVEIGCAPGVMLEKALWLFDEVYGIEPDRANFPFIQEFAGNGVEIIEGYFPLCKMPARVDTMVAMDIVEHIEDYENFIGMASAFLVKGGKFIFMSPILYEDKLFRIRDFLPKEHAWIFTKKYLQEYLSDKFSSVVFDRWVVGHEIVICTK